MNGHDDEIKILLLRMDLKNLTKRQINRLKRKEGKARALITSHENILLSEKPTKVRKNNGQTQLVTTVIIIIN